MANQSIEETLLQLLALVDSKGNPNINKLWQVAKDLEGIKLNLKFFGYELARRTRASWPQQDIPRPMPFALRSKACTQADLESPWAAYWANQLGVEIIYHRKIWELCYVLQALWERGVLEPERRGLGFGCGEEPISSLLAARGCRLTMTDLEPDRAAQQGWTNTHQHASRLEMGFHPHLVDKATFLERVDLQFVDMNAIPTTLRDYDFCWSICSFEHLGSIAAGLAFVESSLATLRPGGVAVHTTEFNFMNDRETIDNWPTVLFQRQHLEGLAQRLSAQGHKIAPLDFDIGSGPIDRFIDLPPYDHDLVGHVGRSWGGSANHLKLMLDCFASTCFGLIIQRAPAS